MTEFAFRKGMNTLPYVRNALTKAGYGHEGIRSAKYSHNNESGSQVHDITFDHEGGIDKGKVYVDKQGKGDF